MTRLAFFSVWQRLGFALVGAVVVLSLIPNPVAVPIDNGDKFEHITAYAVLMLWFSWLYRTATPRLLCAALLALMGVGLEFLQGMSGYRTFDQFDMLANCLGVAFGLAAAVFGCPNVLQWLERTLLRVDASRLPPGEASG